MQNEGTAKFQPPIGHRPLRSKISTGTIPSLQIQLKLLRYFIQLQVSTSRHPLGVKLRQ